MPLIYLPPKVVSSNKKNPTQKSTPQGDSQAIPTDSLPDLNIPKPFIDKLTVNLTFKSAEKAYETHGVMYQALTNDSDYFVSVRKPAKGFKLAKQIAIPDCTSYPRIDYSFYVNPTNGAKLADRIRLEFNPSKLGYWG